MANLPEFKSFSSIERLGGSKLHIQITQKLHGSNGQIYIEKLDKRSPEEVIELTEMSYKGLCMIHDGHLVMAGSRNRWLSTEANNFGFYNFVENRLDSIVKLLGPGTYFGEFVGPGINSTEGVKEKRFVLFSVNQFPPERPRPEGIDVVPILYDGPFTDTIVDEVMTNLKTNGSVYSPGFMKSEGIVVMIPKLGHRFKVVFEAEDTGWRNNKRPPRERPTIDEEAVDKLMQPIRLEKLLSRDEQFRSLTNLPDTIKEYLADLKKEGQLEGVDEVVLKALKSKLFKWVRETILGIT